VNKSGGARRDAGERPMTEAWNDAGEDAARRERRRRYRGGLSAEFYAAIALMLTGHRILSRRWTSKSGEIDLVAVRGRRLVFVEVKRRATLEAAEAAVTARQRSRVRRAAEMWRARYPRYRDHDVCFDLVFLLPGRWPMHLRNAL